MLVGSHAETGNERKAAAAPLPQAIGNVQTAAGFGTLRRATCTSAQATVGDPQTRAHAGRFGMLWLTALTFSLVKEVKAADPDVTFLDDGNIAYKDLEHGAFELVTKEVIPRRFLVDDPGQTIILRSQGSTISVNQSTNSAARMAELQAAQQEALATYEKGLGSTGSGTPPPLERLPVQPINFIQIDGSTPKQDLPPLPAVILASAPEMIIGQLPPPPPTPPTLNAVAGPTEIDTTVFDVFTATSGAFVASSPNPDATLTFGISGGTPGGTVIDGVTYDVSNAGPYGTLYVDSTTGAYTFVPHNDAINALTEPTTTDFTITVSDGTLSANQTFTIAINGANDAATISGATNGTVTEASGLANTAPGTPSATGTLTSADVDNAPDTFTAVSTPTASTRGFGTFTMTTAGVWAYSIDQANSTVQALNVGDTLTDTFTVTTIDGTAQVVTVTINGANDAAVISGATTGSVIEDSGAKCDEPTVTGTLTATDVDNAPGFAAVNCPTASDAGYGTFTMTADGVWTYELDESNCAVQALDEGDTLTDTFTVTTIDGTEQVITVTIHGASDADPNDFDYLATGKAVICDPPYVYGTPGSDSIAGGGHHGQIVYGGAGNDTINGTGKCDLIYAGSGDDTVKGNDGDDRIYGGSGSDTINANNGCDTIIGGYGADKLTGGNGGDCFIYLSAADSRAGRFDVITDFRSGSDRIDLTALGALAFLALTSTSQAVPAHTIAWFYDSATNQTILYVNPTDQTLDIGDSTLLEIRLEGFVTIQASDFVPEPTEAPVVIATEAISPELVATAETDAAVTTLAADASLDGADDDGAQNNIEGWTLRTAGSDSFDFSRLDESPTQAASSPGDDEAIAPTSGPSIEPQRVHVTASADHGLTLDQTEAIDTSVHNTCVVLNDNSDASQRTDYHRTSNGDDWFAPSHNDWSFNTKSHFSAQWSSEDHGRHDDHTKDAWKGNGHGHHSSSGKHDTGSKHGASDGEPLAAYVAFGSAVHTHEHSFHFKLGHHGHGAPTSEPSAIPESAQATEITSSKHHSSDNLKSHWFDSFDNNADHAWSGAGTHAPHDLIV
ncbi:VCBS repeat-containing protein [Bradyrhizobium sp. AZCC 1588]|uniref:VCBS domain-containing protein n=1 Tax=unclassified Bradyrhizobium TaxID=2631580 RepID=UPI002FEF2BAB